MAETKTERAGVFGTIKQLAEEQFGAAQQLGQELRKLQTQNMANAQVAMDESMKLMRATLDYQMKLGEEWRSMSAEMLKPFIPTRGEK
jgi:hypothetical protein